MGDLGQRIWGIRRDGGKLPRTDIADVETREAAYAVQRDGAAAAGLTRIGWKVAATSEAAQQLLGMAGPSIGPLFAEHIMESPATAVARPEQATAVECEFAFVMGADLGPENDVPRETVFAAIDQALTAIEIVGCRFEGGIVNAGALLCISDFSFNASLVTGAPIPNWRDVDLKRATAAMLINGEQVAEGAGVAVLGDPLDALSWAAGEAARIGMPLRAGDIVSTGTMTGAAPVKPGDRAVGDFGPYGRIEIEFIAG